MKRTALELADLLETKTSERYELDAAMLLRNQNEIIERLRAENNRIKSKIMAAMQYGGDEAEWPPGVNFVDAELERLRAQLDSALSFDAGKGVTVEAVPQQNGAKKWKICHMRNVMGRDGEWEWELSPSNRDDEFMARCRFETAEEAFSVLARFR